MVKISNFIFFPVLYNQINPYSFFFLSLQTLALLAKFQKKLHTAILEKPEEKEEGEADEEDETVQEDKEEEEAGLTW